MLPAAIRVTWRAGFAKCGVRSEELQSEAGSRVYAGDLVAKSKISIKTQIYRNRELAMTDVATISRHSTIARAIRVIEAAGPRSSSKRLTNRAERVSTESWELQIR